MESDLRGPEGATQPQENSRNLGKKKRKIKKFWTKIGNFHKFWAKVGSFPPMKSKYLDIFMEDAQHGRSGNSLDFLGEKVKTPDELH